MSLFFRHNEIYFNEKRQIPKMTTAEAIEGITDSGKFEVLATRVLRIEDEDCRLIEHMGVNAVGKTIPNPIDSFCLVASSDPPRFVMAAYTTEKVESLERKWLLDHTNAPNARKSTSANDGDLIKAAHRAELLRKDHPGAKFIVHLCTNRQPNDALMAKVYKRARELGLEVKILAQSRLRDCLDMKPEGQWLRKEHLGIQAELLSLPLLFDLSKKSLEAYGKEFLFTPPEAFVSTSAQTVLQQSMGWPQTLGVVTGMSGTGKSVACYQVLRDHLSKGNSGFWIPGEVAARATTLAEAVEIVLRSLHPTIEAGAGALALHLSAPPSQLLLVIDDINRGGNPSETLRKVITWGRPAPSMEKKRIPLSRSIIVPAWDVFFAPLDLQFKTEDWLAKVPIAQMKEEEAQRCLEASLGSQFEVVDEVNRHQILEALSYDPILITMFAELAKSDQASNQLELAYQVMERFVKLAEAEAAVRGNYLAEEYRAALNHLAIKMLGERRSYPSWENITQWLFPQDVQALRELTTLKKLCRVTERDGALHFEFRHDRILEHHMVQVLGPMLADPSEHIDVLSDPFYTSLIGRALAASNQSSTAIAWLRMHAPLALIAAVHTLSPRNKDSGNIVQAAREWLESTSKNPQIPPTIIYAAYRLLEGIDSQLVMEITEPLSQLPLLARARLANGDARAGAIEFSNEVWFSPAVTDHALDAVLSRGQHRHKQTLIDGCEQMLGKPDLPEGTRRGALILAGFIGDPTLSQPIQVSWDSTPNKQSMLIPALWAAFRCASGEPATLLNPMMSEWRSLSIESSDGLSDLLSIAVELRFAMRRGIPNSTLQYLIRVAKSNEALRWPITHLLECVDHPLVVRFLVEEAAKVTQHARENTGFSPWLINLRDQWDPTVPNQRQRLKPATVDVIRSCWESAESQQSLPLRETAFELWVHTIDDMSVLQSIKPNHPGFDQVLRRRAKLGDISAVPLIKSLIGADKYWFYTIHHIWTEDFREVTDQAILKLQEQTPTDYSNGRTNDHYMLAHLLRDIPISEAEVHLEKHWHHLQYSPLFIQAALYLGTPKLLTFTEKAVQNYPTSADVFKHIGSFFGFFTHGLSDRLSRQHLKVLLPYFKQLSDSTLSSMAAFCERNGHRDWGELHLRPEFEHRRARLPKATKDKQEFVERLGRYHFPSDTDLLDDLDWIEQQGRLHSGHLWHWCEEFKRRQDDHARWRRLLDQWLKKSPTIERLRIFAEAILEHGSRKDLPMLTQNTLAGDQEEVACIVANARFAVMLRSLQ